jgi:hypothetical protein
MKKHNPRILVLFWFLVGCTIAAETAIRSNYGLRKVAPESARNEALENAIPSDFQATECGKPVFCYYNNVDLNDDGLLDTIVYIKGEEVCSPTGNCPVFVFAKSGSDYSLLWESSLQNMEIIVCTQKTKGWHDLLVWVKDKPSPKNELIHSHLSRLRFNGNTYPSELSDLPKYAGKIDGISYLVGGQIDRGLMLPNRIKRGTLPRFEE